MHSLHVSITAKKPPILPTLTKKLLASLVELSARETRKEAVSTSKSKDAFGACEQLVTLQRKCAEASESAKKGGEGKK